jgi:hypothetical protein
MTTAIGYKVYCGMWTVATTLYENEQRWDGYLLS